MSRGRFWYTYGEDADSDINEKVFKLLKAHLQSALGYDEDDDIWMDILDEVSWVRGAIARAILLQIEPLSTKEAWREFHTEVRVQLAEEQRQAAERAARYSAMRQKVHEFWQDHFADLVGKRIEKPEFKALDLASRLRDVLADIDPSIVEAIAEIGLPGSFSNSVAMQIQHIARLALQ